MGVYEMLMSKVGQRDLPVYGTVQCKRLPGTLPEIDRIPRLVVEFETGVRDVIASVSPVRCTT